MNTDTSSDYPEQAPLLKMSTIGQKAEISVIKAEGLGYHRAALIKTIKDED